MPRSKPFRAAQASALAQGIFLVLCLVSLLNSLNGIFYSDQRLARPRNLETIAPKSLAGVARTFELGVRVRDRSFPTDRMTQFPEWADLQRKTSGYAQKLEQLEDQEEAFHRRLQTQGLIISFLSLGAILAAVALAMRARRQETVSTILPHERGISPGDDALLPAK